MTNAAAVDVEVRLRLKDGGTQAQMKAVEKTAEQLAEKTATATERAARRSAKATEESNTRQRTSYEKTAAAREQLGVRSEKAVQKEIENTRRSYATLAAAGFASAQDQERAFAAVQKRVTSLTNEMGKLTAAQKKAGDEARRLAQIEADQERGRKALRTGTAVVVGGTAAAYTLKAPANKAMAFDEQLGLLSNTAFAEYDKSGRKIREDQLRAAIKKAVGTGMTREGALDALRKLISDNQVGGVAGAMDLLPFIGKASTGSGSSGKDVAAMMGSFISSGYAKDAAGAKRLMGISTAASTAGAFEKEDMARHLPGLLPSAKLAGLTGEDGFRRVLVLLQQARTTAGSSDEAARNVANLLAKLQSNDTATDFKKAGRGDLSKYLIDQRAKGVDPLTAWQNVIDSEISKNPNLKPAMARLQKATSKEDQDAAIEAIKGMVEGQSIGKYFQDMQAKGALFGLRNREVEDKVNAALGQSGSIVDVDYENMADRPSVQTRVANEQSEMAVISVMDKLTPAIGRAAEAFSEIAEKYPLLTGTATLATTELAALAGAAGLTTVAMGGKLPGGPAVTKYAGKVATGAKVGGMAGVGALVGGYALDKGFGEDSAITRYGSSALNAAAGGALVGSIFPVIGTAIGAATGGVLGLMYQGLKDIAPAEQKPVDVNFKADIGLSPDLVLRNQTIKSTGGSVYSNTGNLNTGAPQ